MDSDQLRQISLLLVDDETDFRNTLAKRLLKRGLHSIHAPDGETCLAMLAKQPVDVVVMDVMMPGINGIDALLKIKKLYHETEVILLTGNANTQDGVEGIKSGAFDYLTKPVEFEHLLGKLFKHTIRSYRTESRKRPRSTELESNSRWSPRKDLRPSGRLPPVWPMRSTTRWPSSMSRPVICEPCCKKKTWPRYLTGRFSIRRWKKSRPVSNGPGRLPTSSLPMLAKMNRYWRKSTCRHCSAKPSN
jgi:CheY-like chemotaxis protein